MKESRMKKSVLALFLLSLAALASARADSVVYDNTGPDSYEDNAYLINPGLSVSDSFTLSQPATIDAISFPVWTYPGQSLTSFAWEISTESDAEGADLASGTVSSFTSSPISSAAASGFGLDVDGILFDIGDLDLSANTTYYLAIMDANAFGYGPVYWDISGNPNSSGSQWTPGYPGTAIPSETFTLYGPSSSPVPEPPGLLLLLSGMAALALLRWRTVNA